MKLIFSIFLLMYFHISIDAQIYSSINVDNTYLIGNDYMWDDYGIGYKISIGYKYKKKFKTDMNIGTDIYEIYYLSGDKYTINSFFLNFSYIISNNRKIKPYISFGTGYFIKKQIFLILQFIKIFILQ